MTRYQSITSIMKWAGTIVQYVDGDYALPYVYKDGMYYYFGETPQGYVLMMSSLHEIASSKAAQPSVQADEFSGHASNCVLRSGGYACTCGIAETTRR